MNTKKVKQFVLKLSKKMMDQINDLNEGKKPQRSFSSQTEKEERSGEGT